MLPMNLKVDKKGLNYLDDDRILLHSQLLIDNRQVSDNRYYPCGFYRIPNTDDYIIKYCYTCYTRKEIKAIKEMLAYFAEKQNKVPSVDFPIGYFNNGRKLAGQIIKFYPTGVSYDDIMKEKDINLISKHYAHDDDAIHNMFLLFDEVLDDVYEMFENGIYYLDTNPGNIILNDNKVKLIDFDPYYVKFDNKDARLIKMMDSYCFLLKCVLSNYKLIDDIKEIPTNFNEAKTLTKKLENTIRRG